MARVSIMIMVRIEHLTLHPPPLLKNINWISISFKPWNFGRHLSFLANRLAGWKTKAWTGRKGKSGRRMALTGGSLALPTFIPEPLLLLILAYFHLQDVQFLLKTIQFFPPGLWLLLARTTDFSFSKLLNYLIWIFRCVWFVSSLFFKGMVHLKNYLALYSVA